MVFFGFFSDIFGTSGDLKLTHLLADPDYKHLLAYGFSEEEAKVLSWFNYK